MPLPVADPASLRALPSVVEAYATQFSPGLIDLSAPSPRPLPGPGGSAGETGMEFSTPGGSLELRARIAALHGSLRASDVLVTSGASEALAALAAALSEHRRPIAVMPGVYPSLVEMARLAGVDVVGAERVRGAAALIGSNPSVPDGRRVDVEGMIAAARLAGAVPVVDEVYRHIALVGAPPPAAAELDSRAVSVGDLSKPLGLGGLRIGWIATRNAEVREAAERWLRLLTGGPSVLSEAMACRAFETFDAQVGAHTQRARQCSEGVYAELSAAGWEFERAELGLTVCAKPPASLAPGAQAELRARGMFLLAADSFGRPGAYRIGLMTPRSTLREALRVLGGRRAGAPL